MTFSDFREYVPGDDVRAISWNLMHAQAKPILKNMRKSANSQLFSRGCQWLHGIGSQNHLKGEVQPTWRRSLGFAASKNNDNVGLLLFSDQVEHFVPPKKAAATFTHFA